MEATLLGLTKEQWDLSYTLATWVSAFASFLAVAVALWLASRQNRHRAKVTIKSVIVFNVPRTGDPERYVQFNVVNTGDRPIKITQIGWASGVFRKTNVVQHFTREKSSSMSIELAHGQNATWLVPVDQFGQFSWENDIAAKLLQPAGVLPIFTLRGVVSTTVGRAFAARPDSTIRERLAKALARISE